MNGEKLAALEARLEEAEARLAIMDLDAEYARAWDAGDAEGWAAVFTEDGVFDMAGVGNQLLAHTGESATTRSNFYAVHQGKNDYAGKLWSTWGEYLDTWVMKEGEWKISFRKYTTYFNDGPDEINTPAA
jgi:3-phenylpropionate/cinnamic acid dioxygenase small subunit